MSDQPNCPKCEACGSRGPSIVLTLVRTTNGSLFWCEQCRDDINRKNPRVAELERELAAAKKCVTCFKPEYLTQGLPPESEFAVRCIEYRKQLYGCDGPGSDEEAYAAEIARLREELTEATNNWLTEQKARLNQNTFVELYQSGKKQAELEHLRAELAAAREENSRILAALKLYGRENVKYFFDKEFAKEIDAKLESLQFSEQELKDLARSSPPPGEWLNAPEEEVEFWPDLIDKERQENERLTAELTEQRRINAELMEQVTELEKNRDRFFSTDGVHWYRK